MEENACHGMGLAGPRAPCTPHVHPAAEILEELITGILHQLDSVVPFVFAETPEKTVQTEEEKAAGTENYSLFKSYVPRSLHQCEPADPTLQVRVYTQKGNIHKTRFRIVHA